MKNIQRILMIVLASCLLGMTGCAKTHDNTEKENEEKAIQIGMSFDTFVIERWKRDRDVFVFTAQELGAEVNVQNANGDVAKQVEQIEYFIDSKMDVIVVVPIDAGSLSASIKKAQDAGIKVISYDRLAANAGVDLYISFDNAEVGRLMGQAIGNRLLPKDKVLMLCGPLSDNNVPLVSSGFEEQMRKRGIEIADTCYLKEWKAEYATEYLQKYVGRLDEFDAIMCGNDNIAGAVIHTLAEERLAGEIYVVGQDADLEACQRIVEGTQYMTVYKPVDKMATKAAKYAVALAKGETLESVDRTYETVYDGTYMVPYIRLNPIAVTTQNIEPVIIESGFHMKEDVYRNVPDKTPTEQD